MNISPILISMMWCICVNVAVPIRPPTGIPLNFSASIDGPRMLTFSWRSPSEEQQNGPIVGYHLQCISIHDHDHRIEIDLTSNDYIQLTNNSLSVSEVLPNTSYNCSVSASTAAGRGPIASQTISTPEDGT